MLYDVVLTGKVSLCFVVVLISGFVLKMLNWGFMISAWGDQ